MFCFKYQWGTIVLNCAITMIGHDDYEYEYVKLDDSDIDVQELMLSSSTVNHLIDTFIWDNIEKWAESDHKDNLEENT